MDSFYGINGPVGIPLGTYSRERPTHSTWYITLRAAAVCFGLMLIAFLITLFIAFIMQFTAVHFFNNDRFVRNYNGYYYSFWNATLCFCLGMIVTLSIYRFKQTATYRTYVLLQETHD